MFIPIKVYLYGICNFNMNDISPKIINQTDVTYFRPSDISPYITPVANIRPLPNKLLIPKQRRTEGIAILKIKQYIMSKQ